jgi:CRP-like cAMP-binding protein
MNLLGYIEQLLGELLPELKAGLISIIKIEEHKKGAILLREGEYCRKVFYVEKGCLRFFYYDDEGKDITHWFIFEGEFITKVDSVFKENQVHFILRHWKIAL